MGYGYDIPRTGIRLDGVPFTWNTNLGDRDILAFYALIADDPDIQTSSLRVNILGRTSSFSVRVFDKVIEFKEGACHCFGVNDTIYAVYKTSQEWEYWAARRAEIEELGEEQELERRVERELLLAEERHLISKCTEAINGHDYEGAFNWLCVRADLLKGDRTSRFVSFMFSEVFMRLSSFPSRYCIAFLRRYAAPYTSYLEVANSKRLWRTPSDSEMQELFEAAITDHPSSGMLFKEITLFWERRANYDLALKYCGLAIMRSLTDDTKLGFGGRFRRLQKKAADATPRRAIGTPPPEQGTGAGRRSLP